MPAGLAQTPPSIESRPSADWARGQLLFLLQLAYSGELGAARAYAGHRVALSVPFQRAQLGKILRDELRHRRCILRMLKAMGSGPDARRERKMNLIGRAISFFCFVGGWFLPMWGAGKLESQNIREYEHAARLAHVAGLTQFVPDLLEMAEVEWDHERFFREQSQTHFLWRFMPLWVVPPPRPAIRTAFAQFVAAGAHEVEPVFAPWLVR
jgi:hypothetical protein